MQDVDGVEDGSERVAELVREHRQEFILAAIGFPHVLIEPLEFLALAIQLPPDGDSFDRVVHRLVEGFWRIAPLHQVILGASLEGLDGHRFPSPAGQHHHGDGGTAGPSGQLVEELETVEVRQVVIEQQAIDTCPPACLKAVESGRILQESVIHPRVFPQIAPDRLPIFWAVVHDQDQTLQLSHAVPPRLAIDREADTARNLSPPIDLPDRLPEPVARAFIPI